MSRRHRIVPLTPEARHELMQDPQLRAADDSRFADAEWRSRGSCLAHDPEMFFPAPHEPLDAALAVCQGCPVRAACLASALDAADYDGVWGGTTPDQRRAMCQVWPLQAVRVNAG